VEEETTTMHRECVDGKR